MASVIPTSVRFTEKTHARLAKVTARSNTSAAQLIEMAVADLLDRVEKEGKIVIVLNEDKDAGRILHAAAKRKKKLTP